MFKRQTTTTTTTKRCESEIIPMDPDDNLAMMESMLCKEQTIYAQHDYFAWSLPIAPPATGSTATPNSNSNANANANGTTCDNMPVDPLCRTMMAKWCVSLCKFCDYDRRMVASIVSCVDQFVATPNGSLVLLCRNKYQLAVMAALYLVAKVQQTQALEPESIAKLSRGKYTKADIETMELDILTSLKWFVNPPTPMGFAHEFLQQFELDDDNDDDCCCVVVGNSSENDESPTLSLASSLSSTSLSMSSSMSTTNTMEERIMELVKCQIEEVIYDYKLSCLTRPSHVAYGALLNALQSLNIDSSDLDSMRMLKHRLQIITTGDDTALNAVSDALLRAVSSSDESSNNPLRSLLLHRCSGRNSKRARSNNNINNNSNSERHKAEPQRTTDASPSCPKTSSSSSVPAPSSPRTVLEGIPC